MSGIFAAPVPVMPGIRQPYMTVENGWAPADANQIVDVSEDEEEEEDHDMQ